MDTPSYKLQIRPTILISLECAGCQQHNGTSPVCIRCMVLKIQLFFLLLMGLSSRKHGATTLWNAWIKNNCRSWCHRAMAWRSRSRTRRTKDRAMPERVQMYGRWLTAQQKDVRRQDNSDKKRLVNCISRTIQRIQTGLVRDWSHLGCLNSVTYEDCTKFGLVGRPWRLTGIEYLTSYTVLE